MDNKKNNRISAFTLLELLVVIFILSVSLGAMTVAVNKIITYSSFNKSKLTAVYLAQEGMELIRNTRDNNWIIGESWLQGFPDCPSLNPNTWCEIDYSEDTLNINNRYLKINSSGYYNYSAGVETKYKRKIYLDKGINQLFATVNVIWQDNLGNHEYIIKEKFYNWK